MVEFIAGKTKEIMYKCCERHSKATSVSLDDIQLILGLNLVEKEGQFELADESDMCSYSICEKYKIEKVLTIWEVLNVKPKLDFLGYSKLAPPFIFKALMRFAEKYKIEFDKIFILCQPTKNEKNKPDMLLALYDGNKYIEQIKFCRTGNEEDDDTSEYLFDEQDVEMPN
jgi:hypothetical protein